MGFTEAAIAAHHSSRNAATVRRDTLTCRPASAAAMAARMAFSGDRIAFLRRELNMSQAAFGRLIGRSESWVSQVEGGTREIDRLSVLKSMATHLGVPLTDLVPDIAGSGAS
ncbi:helix-turn-helix transcriptional regulator [Pseudofrankia sp. DC12]|uniref:helix-turn-helix domain-containing protein n=1 Tax=Pseudofrankia sp. DC12 TaxID=683315 RepID=UPI001E293C06|nr:helix-turn-helix transcriptional regulator [Pseudofrankia sp. DC12]